MASEAQINANRSNSKNSTGPRTKKGKAASSQNARTHGVYSKHFVLLSTEDPAEFSALHSGYGREFQPATPAERHFVREIVESHWRLARVGRLETGYLESCGDSPDVDQLLKWDRLTTSARRAYSHSLRDLFSLRTKRGYYLALSPDPRFEDPGIGYDDPPPWPDADVPPPRRDKNSGNEPNFAPSAAPEEPASSTNETTSSPAEAPAATPEIDRNEPNSAPPDTPAEPPAAPPLIRVPYPLAEELKDLMRFYPGFDPARSRHRSWRLRDYCKDPDNLRAVRQFMGVL